MDDITSLGTGINYNGGLGVIHSLRDPSPCQKTFLSESRNGSIKAKGTKQLRKKCSIDTSQLQHNQHQHQLRNQSNNQLLALQKTTTLKEVNNPSTLRMPPLAMNGIINNSQNFANSSTLAEFSPHTIASKATQQDNNSQIPLALGASHQHHKNNRLPPSQHSQVESPAQRIQDQFMSQTRRQSQFRSSRLYKNYHNTVASSNNQPLTVPNIGGSQFKNHHESISDIQTLTSMQNQSLERFPNPSKHANHKNVKTQNIYEDSNSSTIKNHSPVTLNKSKQKIHTQLTQTQQQSINQQQSKLGHHQNQQQSKYFQLPQKRLSLYQKRLNQKIKFSQVSLANISFADEKSTDMQDDNSSLYAPSTQHQTALPHQQQSIPSKVQNLIQPSQSSKKKKPTSQSPYKTLSAFDNNNNSSNSDNVNNLKTLGNKGQMKFSNQQSTAQGTNNGTIITNNVFPYSNQYLSSNQGQIDSTNQSLLSAGKQKNSGSKHRFDLHHSEIVTERHQDSSLQQPLLLLKIEEDNNEFKSRARNGQHYKGDMDMLSKISSKTELPELRQSNFRSRLKNNQSINASRLLGGTQANAGYINSSTSSRTQLAQIMNSGGENANNTRGTSLGKAGTLGGSNSKMNKRSSFRLNQENSSKQTKGDLRSLSPLNKANTTIASFHHQQTIKNNQNINNSSLNNDITRVTANTQSSFNSKKNHKIRIEINKEESIINYLTKDHKTNMSLIFYDFNNANQRLYSMQRQNLADLVIPEETEDVPTNNIQGQNLVDEDQNMKIQDDELLLSRQETLLNEIITGTGGDRSRLNQSGLTRANNSMSPRKDVELVNQKINNAKKKIMGKTGEAIFSNLDSKAKNQNSLTHLSIDMVRLGSPFFGQNIQSSQIKSYNQNSPIPRKLKKTPINNKQSDSSLKFSPIKRQAVQAKPFGAKAHSSQNNLSYNEILNHININSKNSFEVEEENSDEIQSDKSFENEKQQDFSFNNELNKTMNSQAKNPETLKEAQKDQDDDTYSNDTFLEEEQPKDQGESKLPNIKSSEQQQRLGQNLRRISTFEYVKDNDELFE